MPVQPATLQPPRALLFVGGAAGGVLFGLFTLGFLAILGHWSPGADNWLAILFDLNFRPTSSSTSALSTLSAIDTTLMLLFGLLMASMYPIFKSTSRAWALIAAVLPFIGVPIFLATGTAGRSAVLLGGLISSILMFRSRFSPPATGVTGILASATLLILGDFATAAFGPSLLIGFSIAAGYVLWTVWLLLVTIELVRRANDAAG